MSVCLYPPYVHNGVCYSLEEEEAFEDTMACKVIDDEKEKEAQEEEDEKEEAAGIGGQRKDEVGGGMRRQEGEEEAKHPDTCPPVVRTLSACVQPPPDVGWFKPTRSGWIHGRWPTTPIGRRPVFIRLRSFIPAL